MTPLSPQQFRDATIARHRAAFDLHETVLREMERAITRGRDLSDVVSRAVDMLFVQAFKSLTAMGELSKLALTEDAATITRRLMELAVWTIFIARDSEPDACRDRASSYLASLWEEWPLELRAAIPQPERAAWEAIAAAYPAVDSEGKRRHRPSFKELFEYAEHPDTYKLDYSHLSSISHGRPSSFVHYYSRGVVQIHDDREVSGLLVYAASYALVTFLIWQEHFGITGVPADELLARVKKARDGN